MSPLRTMLAAVILVLATEASARRLLHNGVNHDAVEVRWFEPANGVLQSVVVPQGGSVVFTWTSVHDLWEIPSASCPQTFTNQTGMTQLAPQSRGGSMTVNFTTLGYRYFACSVGDHCEDGQLITVFVGAHDSLAPAPGPSSRYRGGSSENYGEDGEPESNYGGSNYGDEEEEEEGYGGGRAPAPGPSSRYRGGSSENYGEDGEPVSNYGGSNYGEEEEAEEEAGEGYGGSVSHSYGGGR